MRIQLVVPQNNSTMAGEVAELAPPDTQIDVVRVPRGRGLLDARTLPAYKDAARAAVGAWNGAKANGAKPDLVLYGCTAAGFLSGPQADERFTAEIESVAGAPTVSTAGSMLRLLRDEGSRRPALLSPYSQEVNRALFAFLEEGGLRPQDLLRLEAADVEALGRLTDHDVEKLALTIDPARLDTLFIACSQLPTLGVVGRLRSQLDVPVWTSILASVVIGFKRIGCRPRLPFAAVPPA